MLFCRDPLRPKRVDPHFAREAAVSGKVALVDHDDVLRGEARRVESDPAWYRGWMIPSDRYAELAEARNLVVPAAMYARAHEFPGWYPTFETVTPRSVWSVGVPDDLAAFAAQLPDGPMIVRDYVKSRKHEWDEACYVPDRAALPRVVRRFVELQDDFLAGGIVLRAFEEFTGTEARVWWLDNEPVLVSPHPDTPDDAPDPDLTEVAPLVRALGCRFVTTDVVLRADGRWRVVEVGDGQVSDLPEHQDPAVLIGALQAATMATLTSPDSVDTP